MRLDASDLLRPPTEVGHSVTCTSDAGTCVETDPCIGGACGLVRGSCNGFFDCGPCPAEGGAADAASE